MCWVSYFIDITAAVLESKGLCVQVIKVHWQQPTIFIFNLRRSQENSIRHLDFAARPVVRPVDLPVFAELSQDLSGLHGVSPDVVSMADGKRWTEMSDRRRTIASL